MLEEENNIINSKNCIVCFLDILGYEDLIEKKSSKPEEVEKVYKIFLNLIPKSSNNKGSLSSAVMSAVKVQIISDTLLVILDLEELPDLDRKISHHKEQVYIAYFLNMIASFSMDIISNPNLGCLLRGGIARGQYYQRPLNNEKNQFIFSKALVDAHKLEKLADVPRIVISNDLYGHIKVIKNGSSLQNIEIIRAEDGLYYLDIYFRKYLLSSPEEFKRILLGVVAGVKSQVEAGQSAKVMKKYYWFQSYHNNKLNYCLKHSEGRVNAKEYKKFDLKSLKIDIDSYLKNKLKQIYIV